MNDLDLEDMIRKAARKLATLRTQQENMKLRNIAHLPHDELVVMAEEYAVLEAEIARAGFDLSMYQRKYAFRDRT